MKRDYEHAFKWLMKGLNHPEILCAGFEELRIQKEFWELKRLSRLPETAEEFKNGYLVQGETYVKRCILTKAVETGLYPEREEHAP